VIGAGVIGLECAASARALGCEVVVVEAADRPLGRCMAPGIVDWLTALHRSRGIAFRLGARLLAVEHDGAGCCLVLDGEVILADVVIAGVGLERDLELAAGAGLLIEGAVACDATGRTSAPGIWAAGDVAAWLNPLYGRRLLLESWQAALNQGLAAARSILGQDEPPDPLPWFWTDQHGANVQVAGLPAEARDTVLRGDPASGRFVAFHRDGDGRIVAGTTVNLGRDMRFVRSLARARAMVDPSRLADEGTALKALAAG
jgi:NADPH-dependent 2,4-dienoyl-CoA reductase/sulfur reductase-like enzyme